MVNLIKDAAIMSAVDNQALMQRNVINWMSRLYTSAKNTKNEHDKDWKFFRHLYEGQHWTGYDVRMPIWKSKPVLNFAFGAIETLLGNLVANRPGIFVLPQKPANEQYAQLFNKLTTRIWDINNMDTELISIFKDMLIVGNGFCKISWGAINGVSGNDIMLIPVAPECMFISPGATSLENARYILQVQTMPLDEVKAIWPDKGKYVVPGKIDPRNIYETFKNDIKGEYLTPLKSVDGKDIFYVSNQYVSRQQGSDDFVTVVEGWIRMPEGTIRHTVVANNIILEDGLSPFSHNDFPYVHFPDYVSTLSFYAMGEMQVIKMLQLDINKTRGMLLDILKYTQSPMMKVTTDAGVNVDQIKAKPGSILQYAPGSEVNWLNTPSVPAALFETVSQDKQYMESILGNVDIIQGVRPVGVETGVLGSLLTENANIRLSLKAKILEKSFKRMGRLITKMIQQFYRTERVIRVAGETSLSSDFITISSEDEMFKNNIPQDIDFDIIIGAGGTLPKSRTTRPQQAWELFKAGILDPEGLLRAWDWPNYKDEIQKMKERQKEQIQQAIILQQAQQQTAQPAMSQEPAIESFAASAL